MMNNNWWICMVPMALAACFLLGWACVRRVRCRTKSYRIEKSWAIVIGMLLLSAIVTLVFFAEDTDRFERAACHLVTDSDGVGVDFAVLVVLLAFWAVYSCMLYGAIVFGRVVHEKITDYTAMKQRALCRQAAQSPVVFEKTWKTCPWKCQDCPCGLSVRLVADMKQIISCGEICVSGGCYTREITIGAMEICGEAPDHSDIPDLTEADQYRVEIRMNAVAGQPEIVKVST